VKSVTIGGGIFGAGGDGSGSVQVGGKLGATTVSADESGDSIVGGSGDNSGFIRVGADLPNLMIGGNVRGGTGEISGAVVAFGTLDRLTLKGDLIGATAPDLSSGVAAPEIRNSGYLQATKFTNVLIEGDMIAGQNDFGAIRDSGVIRGRQIDNITINGSMIGNSKAGAEISALGVGSAPAIKNVLIKGDVFGGGIIAGYDVVAAINDTFLPRNPDASIGNVTINGSVRGVSIVAGADAGTDGRFGTADDHVLSGTGITDVAKVISQIASIVIKGAIMDAGSPFGIVAQHIVSVKVGPNGTPIPLLKGAGNDVATSDTDPDPGTAIAPNLRALELRIPA
jgi:hypothetical protein